MIATLQLTWSRRADYASLSKLTIQLYLEQNTPHFYKRGAGCSYDYYQLYFYLVFYQTNRFKTRHLAWAEAEFPDGDMGEDSSADPLLREAGSMLGKKSDMHAGKLQPGKLNILRLVDANVADPSKEKISGCTLLLAPKLLRVR